MTSITIPFQVVNGELRHDANLEALEGQRGIATLTVVAPESPNGKGRTEPEKPAESADFDPEPPPWLEVEHDVYFPITRPAKPLGKVKV